MQMQPTRLRKIFGSGPAGLAISLVLFFGAVAIDHEFNLPPLTPNGILLDVIFGLAIVLTVAVVVWSVKSLPATARGNRLCTVGAFKYMRHPLYGAFLSIFNVGLALYLNSWIYLAWALLLHPVWHWVIRGEEQLMIGLFGETYREYAVKTGRFFPRLW